MVTLGELEEFRETREDVRKQLQERGVVGSVVSVQPYRYRDLKLHIEVGIRPVFKQSQALASVRSAIHRLFSYNNTYFNTIVRTQEIHAFLITHVPEVWYTTVKLYDGPDENNDSPLIMARADELVRVLDSNLNISPSMADPGIITSS